MERQCKADIVDFPSIFGALRYSIAEHVTMRHFRESKISTTTT